MMLCVRPYLALRRSFTVSSRPITSRVQHLTRERSISGNFFNLGLGNAAMTRSGTCGPMAGILPSALLTHHTSVVIVACYFSQRRSWIVKDWRSIQEVLDNANKQIESGELTARTIAAVWSTIPRLLSKGGHNPNRRNKDDTTKLKRQVMTTLKHTLNSSDKMIPRDLTTVILGMAKIIQNVRVAKQRKRMNVYQQAFGNVLLDKESNVQGSIFQPLAWSVNDILEKSDQRCLSNLTYACALLGCDPKLDNGSTLLGNIADASIGCIRQFIPQGISNTVWAYSTLEVSHPLLFQAVGDAVVGRQNLDEFNPQNLANIVWAYSTANEHHSDLFRKVGDTIATKDNLESFDPQALSNIVWAYATANEQHTCLFRKVGDAIVKKDNLESFTPQALANTAWAYATANEQHPGLFTKVGDAIVKKDNLESFTPQALASTAWAYATANEHHPDLFRKVGDTIVKKDNLESFTPQALANVVWAYATANEHHPNLFRKVGEAIVKKDKLESFTPQALANTAWAYATANEQHPGLFKKVGDAIVMKDGLKSFMPQALANIVWAYTTANEQHVGLFRKVGDTVVGNDDLESFKPQDFANILWAYATANEQHPDLFMKIGDAIVKDLKSFNPQNLANTAWAFAVSNYDLTLIYSTVIREELVARQNEFTSEQLRQLYQWHLWQTKEKASNGLPKSMQDKCKQIFLSTDTTSSALQKDVVRELEDLNLTPVEEYLTPSGYSLDALVEIKGKKVGVEVDGPSHFIGGEPNGSTLLKQRQVSTIDEIPLVSIPYWEWDKLGKDKGKKQQYLQSMFQSKLTL